MDDQLKNLKRAMKNNLFNDLQFTDEQKNIVRKQIRKLQPASDDDILLAILQLLVKEKTGFELSRLIRARGIERFEKEEGLLYMFLHRFEQKGHIQSNWAETDIKYYQLTKKGRKLLAKAENIDNRGKTILRELLEG
jgi:DNA-binding PadR family transcriptional regulator